MNGGGAQNGWMGLGGRGKRQSEWMGVMGDGRWGGTEWMDGAGGGGEALE